MFVFGVHRTIFKVLTVWIGTCVILYACLSVLPVIRKDSPYSTPLSGLFSFYFTGIRYLPFRLRRFPLIRNLIGVLRRTRDPRAVHLDDFFSHSMAKTAERYAFKLNPDIDYDSLLRTFQSLDEDSDLEKFLRTPPSPLRLRNREKIERATRIHRTEQRYACIFIGWVDESYSVI